jgi:hypothetical protein
VCAEGVSALEMCSGGACAWCEVPGYPVVVVLVVVVGGTWVPRRGAGSGRVLGLHCGLPLWASTVEVHTDTDPSTTEYGLGVLGVSVSSMKYSYKYLP